MKNSKQKQKTIIKIQSFIDKYGALDSAELELNSSPFYGSTGDRTIALIEKLYRNIVEVVTYVNDDEVDSLNVLYSELPQDLLDEILESLEQYDVEMEKVIEKSRDNNF